MVFGLVKNYTKNFLLAITQNQQNTQGNPDSPYLADEATNSEPTEPANAGSAPPAAAVESAAPIEISIASFAFSASDPVAPGTTITVTNLDTANHTLTARDGSFDDRDGR